MQTAAAELTQNPIGHAPAVIGRPSYREILEGAAAEEKAQRQQAQHAAHAAQVEASHARVAQIALLKERMTAELQEYEALRAQIRACYGRAWHLELLLSQVSNGQVSALPKGLGQNHLAPGFPGKFDEVFPTFRSFAADALHAQAHRGVWPV